ncbi:hypothetical protein SDC9_108833 [bioreactor metagenome]|uniref:Uncharacterized protein n=1 Tax=bioreactor metagenome TaxID=1076179 RepID=A0A645B911_9ZZZZ
MTQSSSGERNIRPPVLRGKRPTLRKNSPHGTNNNTTAEPFPHQSFLRDIQPLGIGSGKTGLKKMVRDRRKTGDLFFSEQGVIGQLVEAVGDVFEIVISIRPSAAVVPFQLQGAGIRPEGFLPKGVEIEIEIGHGQFPEVPVDRLPEPESGEVGLRHGPPAPSLPEDSDHVVVVVPGFEVHHQGRVSELPEACRRKEGALETVGVLFSENPFRRFALLFRIVGNGVEKPLYFRRTSKAWPEHETTLRNKNGRKA